MGKIKQYDSAFKGNYHGIVDHNGCIKVAGYDTSATIKYINIIGGKFHDVLVKGTKKNYVCKIHKHLYSSMIYCDIGDTGFIKFHNGKAYLTGFRKSKSKWIEDEIVIEGDADLLAYFQEQGRLSDVYDSGVISYEH